jgi:menaquinone-dependent protoporphyrinogen oxidase
MSAKILIAYATRAGSTAEIAQAMGKAMTARGAIVDVKPIAQVADIAAYQLIVLGSVVHAGRLMPEVMRFVRAHKAELVARPVAAFTVCLAAKSPDSAATCRAYLDPLRKELTLADEAFFAGKMDYERVGFIARFIVKNLVKAPEGDFRDWAAIGKWAENVLAKTLK